MPLNYILEFHKRRLIFLPLGWPSVFVGSSFNQLLIKIIQKKKHALVVNMYSPTYDDQF